RGDGRQEWRESGGRSVGRLAEPGSRSATAERGPGDGPGACTEGITETMHAGGNEYGRARRAESAGQKRGKRPEEMLRGVLEEVEKHLQGGAHEDDRVLLVMKVGGS